MQLVAYGAQDIYLTGNPQITFFKVVYRRHTNFSMEEIAQTPSGLVDFGGEADYTISRNGDLIHKMYFEYKPNSLIPTLLKGDAQPSGGQNVSGKLNSVSNFGNTLLKEVQCEIGGQIIDTHYSHWLNTWADLTEHNNTSTTDSISKAHLGINIETNNNRQSDKHNLTLYQKMSGNIAATSIQSSLKVVNQNNNSYLIPLRFWFNRNPGLSLPLIALQYHEVKIKITFEEVNNLLYGEAVTGSGPAWTEVSLSGDKTPQLRDGTLFVQYMYLDTDERRRFAQVSHEYLIEQLQFQKESSNKKTFLLNFNHPVKEIIWGGSNVSFSNAESAEDGAKYNILRGSNLRCDKTTLRPSEDTTWKITLNGHDRFTPRDSTYFTRQQIYDHHTGSGSVMDSDCIAVYSFALKPEEHQPSGTCNFSRIDTSELICSNNTTGNINIYAINYNVLRIMSGMGGLAYSN